LILAYGTKPSTRISLLSDPARRYGVAMITDVDTEDARWAELGLGPLAERAGRAALAHLGLDPEEFALSLLGCDDARIAELNAEFRAKPKPTNVLSWPSEDLSAEKEGAAPLPPQRSEFDDPDGPIELGDIAIAWETCEREAAEQGKPMVDHVTHLLVHATLHLLGYDHIRDKDATLMEALEVGILGKLGIPDPY
jgi:probable rRNA maturation factor